MQFGFSPVKGTTDDFIMLLQEKRLEVNKGLFFVDERKACVLIQDTWYTGALLKESNQVGQSNLPWCKW